MGPFVDQFNVNLSHHLAIPNTSSWINYCSSIPAFLSWWSFDGHRWRPDQGSREELVWDDKVDNYSGRRRNDGSSIQHSINHQRLILGYGKRHGASGWTAVEYCLFFYAYWGSQIGLSIRYLLDRVQSIEIIIDFLWPIPLSKLMGVVELLLPTVDLISPLVVVHWKWNISYKNCEISFDFLQNYHSTDFESELPDY